MNEKIGRYLNMAEPFHCDFSHRLFMGHLGNHMLNAADFHSRERGFGMDFLNGINKTWVLSRLAIEMEEMPRQYDEFYVDTWVESAMRYFTNRNFRVVGKSDGRIYGYGRSIWAMIDTETRQPCNLMDVNNGSIMNYVDAETPNPIGRLSRVQMTDAAQLVSSVPTVYNDVDINGHINSVKYIEHVLDLYPVSWYETHRLKRFDIAYVAEAHQGDTLHFYREQSPDNEEVHKIRITKSSSASLEETETCRCMVNFV